MQLPIEMVQRLVEVMERHQLVELLLEWDDSLIHLERQSSGGEGVFHPSVPVAPAQAASPPGKPVEAPMSGMFYRAPSPNDPPYVEEGNRVQVGQTIGLIEAMKVFNEIPAPFAGVVTRIVAQNATFIQAGEILMYIQTDEEGQENP